MNQKQNNAQFTTTNTIQKLLGALSLAALLTAVSPLVANAQDDQPGNDNAHQERNPSQHPELFTVAARSSQPVQTSELPTVRRASHRNHAKVEGRAIFVITPATSAGIETPDDIVGTGAPHQERNPSAHPELWVRGAAR